MTIETDMFISLLKLTRDGPVSHELINNDVRMPLQVAKKLLRGLQKDGLIYVRHNVVEADQTQRVELAVRALKSGADIERVSNVLQWKEFEGIGAIAFERNGYVVSKNVRFKHEGHRWEIDLVACKKPTVVCVDCKHWHHRLHKSILEKIVEEQIARTRALAKSLPSPIIRIECTPSTGARFVPAILSLVIDKSKFFNGVPIVPILQVQDFLNQLPAYTNSLFHLGLDGSDRPLSPQKNLGDKTFFKV